ncbi:MAG: DUF99 family protein [Candidatus Hodarchaeota archaeon]
MTASSLSKPSVRLLGIAESGLTGSTHTILGGIVMRADLIIDGIVWGKASIQGTDASETIIKMVHDLSRTDLNGVLIRGTVIAGYNIVDLSLIHEVTNLPVISVTSEPHENLRDHLIHTFPSNWKARWKISRRNGELQPLLLDTHSTVFVQFKGCKWNEIQALIRRVTRFGSIPEPLRVARLLARALAKNPPRG